MDDFATSPRSSTVPPCRACRSGSCGRPGCRGWWTRLRPPRSAGRGRLLPGRAQLADAREIAVAASQEFGVPLLDLDAIEPDLDTVRIVSEKLLRKHRVLPLVKRGKRLFLGVSDPTNLHAIDEIKFQTGFAIDADHRRGGQAAEAARQGARAGRHLDAGPRRRRLRPGGPRGQRRRRGRRQGRRSPRRRRRRADRPLRQQDHAGRDQAAAPRTSTSSPTRRSTASASAWTAC